MILKKALSLVSHPLSKALLKQQSKRGLAKYGQTLDDNQTSVINKLPHLAQELADGIKYALWISSTDTANDTDTAVQRMALFIAKDLSYSLDLVSVHAESLNIVSLASHDTGLGRVAELEAQNALLKAQLVKLNKFT